jgi:ankyrin repeat protein
LSQARRIPHIYYFFNFRDVSAQSSENFLRSILCQLLHSLPGIPDAINEMYIQHNSGTRRPSAKDMANCFIDVVKTVDEVRVFGDAFDECNNWNILWYFLHTAVESQCPGLRIMFTSRPEMHIQEAANSLRIPSLNLDCDGINKDIELFVSDSLTRDIRFARTLKEGKTLIWDSLVSRANGMYVLPWLHCGETLIPSRFRWVALQLDAASRCRSLNALHRALSSLPLSLDETYRRILESIEEGEQAHVQRILQWLCFSERPLRIEEIAIIYQIADKIQPPFKHEDGLFQPEDIIGICRGLLSLSSLHTSSERRVWRHFPFNNLRIIQLAHFTVKEYLFSSLSSPWTIDEKLSHAAILKSAIAYYLHFMTLDDTIQSLRRPELALKYSLAAYFVEYLPSHLTPVGEHSDLLPSLQLLLHPPSTPIATKFGGLLLDGCKSDNSQWRAWRRAWWRPWDEPIDELIARDPATNLYLAIRLRLPQVCRSLLAMSVYLDLAKPLYSCHEPAVGRPPLVEAVQYEEREIMRMLLDARAKHHYEGLDPLADGSALEEAVKRHDTQVVQMLLEAADDIRKTTSRFGRSLYLAVVDSPEGHPAIIKMLLDAGVDVDGGDGSALYSASERGYEGIVHTLIEAGAVVNMKHGGETALEIASSQGHATIVKMLLEAGADVNAGDGSALYHASSGGYEEVARLLIEAKAAVNMKRDGETALETASSQGHAKIVNMLLDAGADVDAGDGCALYYASSGGYEEVVCILIEAGAAVNLQFLGRTALHIASHWGHVKIVKMLLDAGADVVQCSGWALCSAADRGYEEVVRVLIEAGATFGNIDRTQNPSHLSCVVDGYRSTSNSEDLKVEEGEGEGDSERETETEVEEESEEEKRRKRKGRNLKGNLEISKKRRKVGV